MKKMIKPHLELLNIEEICSVYSIDNFKSFLKEYLNEESIKKYNDKAIKEFMGGLVSQCCITGCFEKLKIMLEDSQVSPLIDFSNHEGASLKLSARNGHLDIVKLIMEDTSHNRPKLNVGTIGFVAKLDDIMLKTEDYGTPLLLATIYDHRDIIKYLLDKITPEDGINNATFEAALNTSIKNNSIATSKVIIGKFMEQKGGYEALTSWVGYDRTSYGFHNTLIKCLKRNHVEMVCFLMEEFNYRFEDRLIENCINADDINYSLELKKIRENLLTFKSLSNNLSSSKVVNKKVKV